MGQRRYLRDSIYIKEVFLFVCLCQLHIVLSANCSAVVCYTRQSAQAYTMQMHLTKPYTSFRNLAHHFDRVITFHVKKTNAVKS